MNRLKAVFAVAAVVLPLISLAGCASEGGMNPAVGNFVSAATGGKLGNTQSKEMQVVKGVGTIAQGMSFNDADARDVGEAVALSAINQYGLVEDDKLNAYVTKVGLTIAAVSPDADQPFTFGVLNSTEVNAFSTPGGYILVTRGALAIMQDEAELAGVLAHEVGHICKDHGKKAIQDSSKFKGLTQIATAGRSSAIGQLADSGVDMFLNKPMSRGAEDEADAEAVKYVKLAGYDPNGLIRFLQRAESPGEARNPMRTHPISADRIAKIRAAAGSASGVTLKERFAANVK